MEFPFNCEKILGVDAEGFAIIDGKKGMNGVTSTNRAIARALPEIQNNMYDLIDKMGAASAKAQALPAIITTASRLFTSDNRLYLRAEGNKVIGLLKVGVKKLFIRNDMGAIKEISPLCVLDFYVHESV
jgi:alpha-tubulin N-acetyltransferase 1